MRKDTVDRDNAWAKSRGLVPESFTQILSELASVAMAVAISLTAKNQTHS